MINGYFDLLAFRDAIDTVREARHATWHQIYHETGLNLTILGKVKRGTIVNIHSLATLALWSGVNLGAFVRSNEGTGECRPAFLVEAETPDLTTDYDERAYHQGEYDEEGNA